MSAHLRLLSTAHRPPAPVSAPTSLHRLRLPVPPPPAAAAAVAAAAARGEPSALRRLGLGIGGRAGRRGRRRCGGGGGHMGAGAGHRRVRRPRAGALDLWPAHEPHRHHGHRPDLRAPARRARARDSVLRLPKLYIHVPIGRNIQHGGHLLSQKG